MGLPDGRKSFKIGLTVYTQYWRVTDTQPPTQPASQPRYRSKDHAYEYDAREKNVSAFMLSRSNKQKIQSLTINDCRNSREGMSSQCSTLTQVWAEFGVYWVICGLQNSSSFKTQRLRRRRALQTEVVDDGALYKFTLYFTYLVYYASSGILSDLLY